MIKLPVSLLVAAVFAATVFVAALPGLALAAEFAGVTLDDKIRLAPSTPELVLNGVGARTRLKFKVYVGALYLTEKKTEADKALALGGPKRVSMSMLRGLTAQQVADALNEGIQNNTPQAEMERIEPQIGELNAIVLSIGEVKRGDVIAIDYLPEQGTRISVNGKAQGRPLAGEEFNRAVLRVWLGERPVDADLKDRMLGQEN